VTGVSLTCLNYWLVCNHVVFHISVEAVNPCSVLRLSVSKTEVTQCVCIYSWQLNMTLLVIVWHREVCSSVDIYIASRILVDICVWQVTVIRMERSWPEVQLYSTWSYLYTGKYETVLPICATALSYGWRHWNSGSHNWGTAGLFVLCCCWKIKHSFSL